MLPEEINESQHLLRFRLQRSIAGDFRGQLRRRGYPSATDIRIQASRCGKTD